MRPVRPALLLAALLACAAQACARPRLSACGYLPCATAVAPCFPGADAPPPVGSEAADRVGGLLLRAYDVRDLLDAMPVFQVTGPGGPRVLPAQEALTRQVLERLEPLQRAQAEVYGTATGSLVVKAPPTVQAGVAAALSDLRDEVRAGLVAVPPAPAR